MHLGRYSRVLAFFWMVETMDDKQPTCEFYEVCPFFQDMLADMPSTAKLNKENYCYSDYQSCARYVVTMEVGAEHVPDTLFPNNEKGASDIILRVKNEQNQ